jgi:hypothetical protein
MGHNLFHPHFSHFFILLFDVSSSEQMKKREKWKLIIQEAKFNLICSAEGKQDVQHNSCRRLCTYVDDKTVHMLVLLYCSCLHPAPTMRHLKENNMTCILLRISSS